jgi:hypothetical protein
MTWDDLHLKLPGLRGQGVHVLPASREAEVRAVLTELGFLTCTLQGSAIRSEATLFAEAKRGLDLPDWFGGNWDALHDALGELAEAGPPRKAILWTDAEQSLQADTQLVLDAVLALGAAARAAALTDPPGQLVVFLFGSAWGFDPV